MRRHEDDVNFGWGVCIGYSPKSLPADDDDPNAWSVDVAVLCSINGTDNANALDMTPCTIADYTSITANVFVVKFSFLDIIALSRMRINLPASVFNEEGKKTLTRTLDKLDKQFGEEKVPRLTPDEMKMDKESAPHIAKIGDKIERLKKRIANNELVKSPTAQLEKEFDRYKEKEALGKRIEHIREQLRQMQKTVLKDELKQLMRVLRRLDYIDKDNMILRKGRVACEITTDDENEVLMTELLFKGVLNTMETEMIVALLSCLVNVHKTPDNFSLPQEFEGPYQELKTIVKRIADVSIESGVTGVDSGKAADEKLFPSLMEVTYKWTKGARFLDVVGLTSAYEGDIVRMMRRLEELLRQMAGAARSPAIGSTELHDKFMAGITLIKRDIIFASSLYL